jgi:hypothetical protein
MSLRAKLFQFKKWALSEWKYVRREPKGVVVNEDMADFIHCSLIGIMLGFVIGLYLLRTL